MVRVRHAPASRKRRKKVMKQAKGQRGGRSKLYRTAKESVMKGMAYSFRDRKKKKSNFRALWITRIGIACKEHGIPYSVFIDRLKKKNIALNRKMLAQLAVEDPKAISKLVKEIA